MRKVAWRVYLRSTVLLWAALFLFSILLIRSAPNIGWISMLIAVALAVLVYIDLKQQGRDIELDEPGSLAAYVASVDSPDDGRLLDDEDAQGPCAPADADTPASDSAPVRPANLQPVPRPETEPVPHAVPIVDDTCSLVCIVVVDNYDELITTMREPLRPAVIAEVDTRICNWFVENGAAWRKHDRDRFFAFMQPHTLESMQKTRFPVLDRVREIQVGNQIPPTLSIGIGVAATPGEANLVARQALELALGRGGDQTVIKNGSQYSFYGGNARTPTERRARVKSRLVAEALRRLMEQCRTVSIVSHSQPDYDSFGAMLGIASCANALKKPVRFYYRNPTEGLEPLTAAITEQADFSSLLTLWDAPPEFAVDDLLILVDTQRPSYTDFPEIFTSPAKTVVIDHHIRGEDAVQNPTLSYIETGASSTSELVTEITQYFDDDLRLRPMVAEALLAGIMVDTKRFAVNTSARTLEAASYLRRVGADARMVRELFCETRQSYLDRADVVRAAQMLPGGIALSVCPENLDNARLIAAQSADILLTLRETRAAFVLYRNGNGVSVSGRSLGDIDVQRILEELGGGGGRNAAGAQLENTDIESALERLRAAIETSQRA